MLIGLHDAGDDPYRVSQYVPSMNTSVMEPLVP